MIVDIQTRRPRTIPIFLLDDDCRRRWRTHVRMIWVTLPAMLDDFETIRPYRDDEVPAIVARLIKDPDLCHAAALFFLPRLTTGFPALGHVLTTRHLRRRAAHLRTVRDVQALLSHYVDALIEKTIFDFTLDGLNRLAPGRSYLFISTHRDIVMDSGLMNVALHRAGHQTSRIAVGDNLLGKPFAADLMRLNKSFVVRRSLTGTRALYQSLRRTSAFIRASLEEGESVWIAQREGRSKDGLDRTAPALIKMLALAHDGEMPKTGELCERVRIVPVAVTYEIDPCAPRKARELYVTDRDGRYDKPEGEDLTSMVEGMLGFKGRVHLHFGERVLGDFADADALAGELDRRIVRGLRIFPTHLRAARQVGLGDLPDAEPEDRRIAAVFAKQIESCPAPHRPFLFDQYANLVRNKRLFV